ncbi:helix-turn-helix domain-containing protein [Glaciimonas sp. GNP009]|uniref:helix-turn-helix domain-containing protein n=1 Tax=Glaciimonas sp. CA11.2 TaxID=3048601 RepID=UPI002AB4AEBE|nr:helix-turn-helix transcriptional regulator [Glaciimonas sp. CA11.2]MDY7547253.1 helix-turn-helix transcriptional regulator [Glaciimonas sp. CA11.2]
MSNIFDRLRLERKRLGLNQDEFAAIGGVKKGAQFNYENGTRNPDSSYLAAIAEAGVDVQYVLTGKIGAATLAAEESELVASYRALDIRGKAGVLGMIDGLSDPKQPPESPAFINHGKVGQQIVGGINAPQTFNMGGRKKKKNTIPE